MAEQAGGRVVASPADHGLRCSFWLWEQLEAPAGVFTVSLWVCRHVIWSEDLSLFLQLQPVHSVLQLSWQLNTTYKGTAVCTHLTKYVSSARELLLGGPHVLELVHLGGAHKLCGSLVSLLVVS